MYTFNYRSPRFSTDFPVEFVTEQSTLRGHCSNINSSGIQAEFTATCVAGTLGMLAFDHPAASVNLHARITYVTANQVGIAFIFQTEQEHALVLRFVETISGQPIPLSPLGPTGRHFLAD